MKKPTEKFLNEDLSSSKSIDEDTIINAEGAYKKFKVPKKLWYELSKHHKLLFSISQNKENINIKINTAFMAGFVVGWIENNKKIK